MKRFATKDLLPGMVCGEDVFTYSDQLLIPRGTVLTDKTITKLEFYSIINVRIDDEASINLTQNSEQNLGLSHSQKIQASQYFREFRANFENSANKFQKVINSVVSDDTPLDLDELFGYMESLINCGNGYLSIFDMLHNLRGYDDLTYIHSVNVSLMCNVFAKWLHFGSEEIRLATLSGLLHDIGKLMVPEHVLTKPGKLSKDEYTLVKKHTIDGYNLLKRHNVPSAVANSALMHHERCDGTGYPLGLTNSKIDSFAKMVAIVDVYDAMTCARVYRGPLCPFKVVEIFEDEGLQRYDTRFIMTFLENIVTTYLMDRVRLSDGRIGDIVFINRSSLAKPTVKCGNDFIDLSTEPDLHIEAIV